MTEDTLETLRRRPVPTELFGGFGPLALAVGLLAAMAMLVPSVAPERTVEVPATGAPSTEVGP